MYSLGFRMEDLVEEPASLRAREAPLPRPFNTSALGGDAGAGRADCRTMPKLHDDLSSYMATLSCVRGCGFRSQVDATCSKSDVYTTCNRSGSPAVLCGRAA